MTEQGHKYTFYGFPSGYWEKKEARLKDTIERAEKLQAELDEIRREAQGL